VLYGYGPLAQERGGGWDNTRSGGKGGGQVDAALT